MGKKFNDTGLCIPNKHYMVDTSTQLKETIGLIEEGKYFIINRPRQFGKTTTLRLLEKSSLLKGYIILSMSFEGIGDTYFDSEPLFVEMFIRKIQKEIKFLKIKEPENLFSYSDSSTFENLSDMITDFIDAMNKPVILLIDEVDKSSNNKLFINFLALLRDKYLLMNSGREGSFYSIILAGLHDVKTLKLKLRSNEETSYNSPWNIAVSYDVDMTFKAKQIETMLVDYLSSKRSDNKIDSSPQMDIAKIAEVLYYHTSGYPYFVSKLCKIIDEKIKPTEWRENDIIEAIKILLREENNANFDTVIKNLVNNIELYKFLEEIVLNSKVYTFTHQATMINFAKMNGMIKEYKGKVAIQNRIYDEYITDFFISERETRNIGIDVVQSQFLKDNGRLDIKLLLTKFKDAIEEKYSTHFKSDEFLENDLRMQFVMYLKPVVNGIGFVYKEVQISEEKRLDLIVLFKDEKFIIELKLWRGEKLHKQGIEQIKDYMKREHCDKGYMVIMNKNQSKEFKTTDEDGIFTTWV